MIRNGIQHVKNSFFRVLTQHLGMDPGQVPLGPHTKVERGQLLTSPIEELNLALMLLNHVPVSPS